MAVLDAKNAFCTANFSNQQAVIKKGAGLACSGQRGLVTVITRMHADARVQRIHGGTSEIMKRVIARAL